MAHVNDMALRTLSTFTTTISRVTFYLMSLIVLTLALPVLLPIMLSFRLYKALLSALVRYYSNGEDHVMDGIDAIWLQDSDENHLVINTLLELNGDIDIRTMQETIQRNIVEGTKKDGTRKYDVLTKYAEEKFYRYVWCPDKEFDIKNQVFTYPGHVPKDEESLKSVVSEIMSTALPERKPSWQYILIPFEGRQKSAILFRCHHSIADGMTLLKMFENSFVDTVPAENQKQTFGSSGKWIRVLLSLLTGPGLLFERLIWPADDHLLHGPALSGKKIADWSSPVDLSLIKRIKNTTGSTVNDVLVSCLGGALQKYCQKYGNLENIPHNMLAFIPVDLRPRSAPATTGNQFGCVYLNISTNEDDHSKRLQVTHDRMAAIKKSAEPLVTEVSMDYAMNRFPGFMSQWIFDAIAKKYTMVLSNVPGPREKHTFLGVSIDRMIFWPPQRANVGIGISILSYGEEVGVGVEGDEAVLSDPKFLCESFIEQVRELASELKMD